MADPIQILKPCDLRWSQLVGDDVRRFCSKCNKYVHNLDMLPPAEVDALRKSGGFCATYIRRAPDAPFISGTPTFAASNRTPSIAASMAAAVSLSTFAGCSGSPQTRSLAPTSESREAQHPRTESAGDALQAGDCPDVPTAERTEVRDRHELTEEELEMLRALGYSHD